MWQPDPVRYGVKWVRNVRIRMSDGVRLVGDVFYPTDLVTGRRVQARFPVLLTQNPYSPKLVGDGPGTADYFVPRGYISVEVDVRGMNRSGGFQTVLGDRQAEDGTELVDWAAHKLSGSNGTVGLQGESYLGINQLLTASRVGPHSPVKAIAPLYAGAELYREPATDGGIPTWFILGLYRALTVSSHGPRQTDVYRRLAEATSGRGQAGYDGAAYGADREPRALAAAIVRNGIPALLWSGSADLFPFGTLELYAEFQNAFDHRFVHGPMVPRQRTSGRYQVVFGDYTHGEDPGTLVEALSLEWYDTWLKGQHTGMSRTSTPVHILERGDNRWVNARTYPIVHTYTPYYLDGGGTMSARQPVASGGDRLAWAAPTTPGSTLSYTTPPFSEGATLAGPINASIVARSTASNVELALELEDVAPDGTVSPLTSGALLGSHRAVDAKQSWYDDQDRTIYAYHPFTRASERRVRIGAAQRYDISIAPRFFAVEPGHRLQLRIQTDVSERPAGTAAGQGLALSVAQRAQLAGGVYEVGRGPRTPSVVNLPLLPLGQLPSASVQTGPLDWGQ